MTDSQPDLFDTNTWMDKDHLSIPEARQVLSKLALQHDMPELLELAKRMVRRKPKYPVARATRRSLDPETAKRIRAFKDQNPNMSNRAIGEMFGVDGGRVSEAIHDVFGYDDGKDQDE